MRFDSRTCLFVENMIDSMIDRFVDVSEMKKNDSKTDRFVDISEMKRNDSSCFFLIQMTDEIR